MKITGKILGRVFLFLFLTALTQIGGLVYIVNFFVFRKRKNVRSYVKPLSFLGLYTLVSLFLLPVIAPFFGRERVKNTELIEAHSFFYTICNRTYVKPELNEVLNNVARNLDKELPGIKLIYLDANFPFIDGFPLLPHLSHDDGEKIDVTFIYERDNALINEKISRSGYGIYESPTSAEFNQCEQCKKAGYWQYDFTKYASLGSVNPEIQFSKKGTKALAEFIIKEPEVGKLFIEPHLKTRLGLNSDKVRFQGCRAVRHDDHIHFQLVVR